MFVIYTTWRTHNYLKPSVNVMHKHPLVLLRWPFRDQSIFFSCSFVRSEIGAASNIKDRCNRRNVIRVLTIISELLKSIKSVGDNGILLFVGIDISGYEIKHIITPPNPINEFCYSCSRHFDTDRFDELFTQKPIGNIVFIDGNECIIYQYVGQWKKIKSINANLVKRQKKGGQSQHRFERLAEISRADYITHVIDIINQIILPNQNNYVFGSREIKEMLLEKQELKIKFKTDDVYHVFNDKTILDTYFRNLMIDPVFSENKKVECVIDLLNKGDTDYLLYTTQEIDENFANTEYIINVHDDKEIKSKYGDKSVNLPRNHKYFGQLQYYKVIGKLYVRKIDCHDD